MIRRPPRSTRTDTLFPYTTLFRSDARRGVLHLEIRHPYRDLDRVAARDPFATERVADRIADLQPMLPFVDGRGRGDALVEERRLDEAQMHVAHRPRVAGVPPRQLRPEDVRVGTTVSMTVKQR